MSFDYEANSLSGIPTEKTPVRSRTVFTEHIISVNRDIIDLVSWQDELDILRDATENDTIYIRFNSDGGDLYIATEFLAAQNNCPAQIIGELTGRANSAASIMFMCCDSYIIHPFTRILIHTCSYGQSGNSHENYTDADTTKDQMREIISHVYKHFLLEEEVERVLKGETFIFLAEEIIDRLEYREEMLAIEASEEIVESNEEKDE